MPDSNAIDPQNTGPFWMGYHVSPQYNREMLYAIADLVENPVSRDDLHMTLFYAGDNPASKAWPYPLTISTRVEVTGFALLGDSLVALLEPSKILTSRFADISAKYPTTFVNWIPHITIAYRSNADELDFVRESSTLGLELAQNKPVYLHMDGEFINVVKNPDTGADTKDTAAMIPLGERIDVSAKRKKPKLEKMLGRGGLLRAFNTSIAKSGSITKAWDGDNFDNFKASCKSILNEVRAAWDAKNEAVKAEKEEKAKRK